MHADKHRLLEALDPTLRAALQVVAARHGITVDTLVTALTGRAPTFEGRAAAAHPGFAGVPWAELLAAWPRSCAFCDQPFEAARECAFCPATGCRTCVLGAGCPPCREKFLLQRSRAKESA